MLADPHVTLAYSTTPVDVSNLVERRHNLALEHKGRSIEKFGDTVVLRVEDPQLHEEHQRLRDAGASHDFPRYQPHISITRNPGNVDLSKVKPFMGSLTLNGEVRNVLDPDAGEDTPEVPTRTSPDAPMPEKDYTEAPKWALPRNAAHDDRASNGSRS